MSSDSFTFDYIRRHEWSIWTHHHVGLVCLPFYDLAINGFYGRYRLGILGVDVVEEYNLLDNIPPREIGNGVDILLPVR